MYKKSVENVFRAIFVFVFILGTIWVPHKSAMAETPCPSNMVSYWTLDDGNGETAKDEIDGNQLTLGISSQADSQDPTWVTGNIAGALMFDGVDDLARGGSLPQMSEGTIEAWVDRTSYGNYPNPVIFSMFIPGTYTSAITVYQPYEDPWGTKTFQFIKIDSSNTQIRLVSPENAWDYNNSYHVVATWGSTGMKLYINGVLSDSKTYYGETEVSNPATDFIGSTAPIEIGDYVAYGHAGWQPFAGTIDEVAVYNTALTPTEIQQHYQSGLNGQPYCETGLENQPPIADAGGPYSGFVGEPITLDASASSDPDGDPLIYEWDLDNDGEFDDAVGVTTTATFNQAGEHTVALQVTDPFGLTSMDTAIITASIVHDPSFDIWIMQGSYYIEGNGWPIGEWITLTIDDPATPASPDVQDLQKSMPSWSDHQEGTVHFHTLELERSVGQVISMSDGTTTRTYTLDSMDLQFVQVDSVADTVYGTADPNSLVQISIGKAADRPWREEPVDADGFWSANFAQAGDQENEESTFDIDSGTGIWITQYDPDGESISNYMSLPIHSGSWESKASMNTARKWHGAAVVGDKLYVVGGTDTTDGYSYLDSLEVYDPATNEWTIKAPMPTARNRVVAVELDGLLYVMGGRKNPEQAVGTLEVYDPITDTWEVKSPSPTTEGAAAAVVNGRIYLIGGYDSSSGQTLDLVTEYDPASDTWNAKSPAPNVFYGASAVAIGTEIYVLGGISEFGFYVYDTVSDTWSARSPLPGKERITDLGLATHDGQIYVVAGRDLFGLHAVVYREVWKYDPVLDMWSALPSLPDEQRYIRAAVIGGNLYVVGGSLGEPWPTGEQPPVATNQVLNLNVPPSNQAPIADAGGPYSGYVGDFITLDASASSDPDADPLTYTWDLNNDGLYDDANSMTVTTTFTASGDHTVGLLVTDEGGLSNSDAVTITVLPWTLRGFYQPVDMNGTYNLVKGGSTVPVKFEIFAGSIELTNLASINSLRYIQVSCDAGAPTDQIETTVTGNTSLRYDSAAGQFIYNWKTPNMPGECYRATMTTIEGSSLVAYFKLK